MVGTLGGMGKFALISGRIAAVVVLACALSGGPADAAARPVSLPKPTGRYEVGAVDLHLVDRTRLNPWPGKPQKYRELMVSVFYPTTHAGHHPPQPYMLPKAAEHFDTVTTNGYLGMHLPTGQIDWAATRTHVARAAPVAGRGWPVLINSPGLGEPRTWDTALVTELASRGYVVVTIDNTYESPEVQFPDGFLATLNLPPDADGFIRDALEVRVQDTSFVLDQLTGSPDWRGVLDLTKVGMFGHSAGGTAAGAAMDADPRITAGVNMDGNLTWLDGSLQPVAEHGLRRPYLLMGKDGVTDTGPGWDAFKANTPGWTRQLTLRGSEHASFTDAEALLPQLNLPPDVVTGNIGTIDPAVALRTQSAYLSAFFDRWLRGRDNGLLDGPSPDYPAMEFAG